MNEYKRLMNELHTLNNTMTEFLQRIVSIVEKDEALRESLEPAKPIEMEYRAGEWVPGEGQIYFFVDSFGDVCRTCYTLSLNGNEHRVKTGNAYPTEAIAEAAKEHADWWREFDMTDEGGDFYICVNRDNDIRVCECDRIADGTPRYKNEMSARAAIERLGGEQKVIDMLTRGRVFKFKWGGQ